jgi:hypothetical protein
MVKLCSYRWVKEWCDENGWTDLFIERYCYWAFPPGSVMPIPVPTTILRTIREEKGWSVSEKVWAASAVLATITASGLSFFLRSPMPLVAAFAFCAVAVGQLEVEEF